MKVDLISRRVYHYKKEENAIIRRSKIKNPIKPQKPNHTWVFGVVLHVYPDPPKCVSVYFTHKKNIFLPLCYVSRKKMLNYADISTILRMTCTNLIYLLKDCAKILLSLQIIYLWSWLNLAYKDERKTEH